MHSGATLAENRSIVCTAWVLGSFRDDFIATRQLVERGRCRLRVKVLRQSEDLAFAQGEPGHCLPEIDCFLPFLSMPQRHVGKNVPIERKATSPDVLDIELHGIVIKRIRAEMRTHDDG